MNKWTKRPCFPAIAACKTSQNQKIQNTQKLKSPSDGILEGMAEKWTVTDELLTWKNKRNGKSAMMIEGARRVGKSYLVEEFARREYRSCIIIDFFKVGEDIKDLFKNYKDNLDMLFTYLSTFYSTKLYPRESVIVFDEIEFCPAARSAVKYLVADGRYDYLETGSLYLLLR